MRLMRRLFFTLAATTRGDFGCFVSGIQTLVDGKNYLVIGRRTIDLRRQVVADAAMDVQHLSESAVGDPISLLYSIEASRQHGLPIDMLQVLVTIVGVCDVRAVIVCADVRDKRGPEVKTSCSPPVRNRRPRAILHFDFLLL